MDGKDRPRTFPFPYVRNLTVDLLHFGRHVPRQPLTRQCRLAPLAEARQQGTPRIGWSALFMKAYGLVARDFPVLRQAYMRWPWPYLYQHHESVCSLAISREVDGHEALFFPQVLTPEDKPLTQIQDEVMHFASSPVREVGCYRRHLRYCSLPTALRRFLWWLTMSRSGSKRVRHFGTFGMTSVGSEGADTLDAYSIHTGCLAYGPVDADGRCFVTIIYDHRVTDGRMVGRCLAALEATLNGPIREELLSLRRPAAA